MMIVPAYLAHRCHAEILQNVTCVVLSKQGTRLGTAHPAEVQHHVWYAERQFLAERENEDAAFFECVPGYPQQRFFKFLQTHIVMYTKVGPERLGFPTHRKRFLGALLNPKNVRCYGPPTQ